MTSPEQTDRDPLAAALRSALDAETPDSAADDAILARAIQRATETLAAAKAAAPIKPEVAPVVALRPSPSQSPSLKRRTSSRALRLGLPLAAAFAASLAIAAYVSSTSRPPPSPHVEPTLTNEPKPPTTVAAPEPTPTGISVNDLPTAAPPSPSAIAVATAATTTTAISAEDLFRDANAERRAGNVGKATQLYRLLQKQHPGSAEAHASRVSLGRLLLDKQGDSAGALAEFDAYLKGGVAADNLAEEARVGRATALERLGRAAEERQAWEELIKLHPSSLHVTHARERLKTADK